MHGAQIRDVPQTTEADEAAGPAVTSCVHGQHGIVALDEPVGGDERVDLLAVPAEAMDEHDRRPAAGRGGATRQVERRRDGDAVVHRDRDIRARQRGAARVPDESTRAAASPPIQALTTFTG